MSETNVRLDSYGAFEDGWGRRETIAGLDALAERLARARARGERLTLRARGWSFHDQAQGEHVLDLARVGAAPHIDGDTLRAGASTHLRGLLDVALGAGHTLPILASASSLTLAGAVATASIARGSCAYGRTTAGVLAFTLLTPDGALRAVRRPGPGVPAEEAALFRAVVGGFGAIGVVVDVTLRALPLPWVGLPRVETMARALGGPADALDPLLASLRAPAPDASGPWRGHTDPTIITPWAVTHEEGRALAFTHRLVAPGTPLARFRLHDPPALLNQLSQWATSFDRTAALLPPLLHRAIRARGRPFVDPIHDATFMMDGSASAQTSARRLGVRMGVLQQSYALPVGIGADDAGPTARFLEATFRRLRDARVSASVIDLLGVAADDSMLSACGERPAIAVSVAFQHVGGARAARAAKVLARLSRDALEVGGRVHLVKHVFAEPELLEAMYGDALRAWTAVRDRYDPERVLSSHFLDRLTPRGARRPGG
jgi:decaprenylphospho-beta-D-ribofuranose 2-oxidase